MACIYGSVYTFVHTLGVEFDRSVLIRAEEGQVGAWKMAAKRRELTLSAFARMALDKESSRVVPPPIAETPPERDPPRTSVRVGPSTTAGVGRLGEVRSGSFERERERAREMAMRTGKCTADVAFGTRCRLCGEKH